MIVWPLLGSCQASPKDLAEPEDPAVGLRRGVEVTRALGLDRGPLLVFVEAQMSAEEKWRRFEEFFDESLKRTWWERFRRGPDR